MANICVDDVISTFSSSILTYLKCAINLTIRQICIYIESIFKMSWDRQHNNDSNLIEPNSSPTTSKSYNLGTKLKIRSNALVIFKDVV